MFKNIIFLSGMPRSGTSWLSQVFDSSPQVRFRLSPVFSYELKNSVNEDSDRNAWELLFERAYHSDSEFMDQTYRREAGEYPIFSNKENLPEFLVVKDTRFHNLTERMLALLPEMRMVGIVRHPCGAINSWLRAPKEFPTEEEPLRQWRTGECRKIGFGEFWGFDDWKWVTNLFLHMERGNPERFFLVQYEDIVSDPFHWTRAMFDFCGLNFSDQTEQFLVASQSVHVDNEYAVFKSPDVKDKWQTQLDPAIIRAITDELQGTSLERFLK
jgi:Sulfotransferase family